MKGRCLQLQGLCHVYVRQREPIIFLELDDIQTRRYDDVSRNLWKPEGFPVPNRNKFLLRDHHVEVSYSSNDYLVHSSPLAFHVFLEWCS